MSETTSTKSEAEAFSKGYEPREVEAAWSRRWLEAKVFAASDELPDARPRYVLPMPPPNVTGSLHMGHALFCTLEDILTRHYRMRGHCTLWQPGIDHAGIATQTVVERNLKREGLTRHDLGREKFIERVWQWKTESGGRIAEQQRVLGVSADWDRSKFTMDPDLCVAVTESFCRLYEEGLIYRDTRLVHWDCEAQTVLSNLEVDNEPSQGELFMFAYPVSEADGGGEIVVATTRPETMLGDTAVAVHPDDPRYHHLHGKLVQHPFVDRKIPIVCDAELVDMAFGTGAVKVTPAHDFNDFATGKRHKLEEINILTLDGKMNDRCGTFAGMDRFVARKAVKKALDEQGLARGTKQHDLILPKSQRNGSVVEPMISTQWFVKMKPLAEPALAAVERGETVIIPEEWTKTYSHWMTNILDWCISRQLWWGHRIPAWHCADCGAVTVTRADEVSACSKCGSAKVAQDEDVLDTWFSSALWPVSTLGWPDPARFGMQGGLDAWNPSAVLSTAREIITLWVSRMVMFNRHFLGGRLPFRHVFIHAMVQDGFGQKMSKSLGNGVDPRDIIATHGADAMRFTLVQMTTDTQDVRMPVDMLDPWSGETFTPETVTDSAGYVVAAPVQKSPKDPSRRMTSAYGASTGKATPGPDAPLARNTSARFDVGRNFANKVWNATRFALGSLQQVPGDASIDPRARPLVDRWIVARLAHALASYERAIAGYRFNEAADATYDFVWREVCDWYLESIKHTVRQDPAQQQVLRTVLDASMRLLHPQMPFITEQLWPAVQATGAAGLRGVRVPASDLCTRAAWPEVDAAAADAEALAAFTRVQQLVDAIRTLRGARQVPPKRRITLLAPAGVRALVSGSGGVVEALAGLEAVADLPAERPSGAVPLAFEGQELLLVNLVDAVDVGSERSRLERLVADKSRVIAGYESKLGNPGYVAKAPPKVVEETRAMLAQAKADVDAARRALDALR